MNKNLTFKKFKEQINELNVGDDVEINFALGSSRISFDKYKQMEFSGTLMPGIVSNNEKEIKIDFTLIFTEK